MINNTGAIKLSSSPDCSHTARTKTNISEVKTRLGRKKRFSTRKLAAVMKILRRGIQRILKQDFGYFSYKKIKEPRLTELHKTKRVKFANCALNNYTKDDINWWFFFDEKFLISTGYTTSKTIGFGHLLEQKWIDKVVYIREQSFPGR